MVHQLLIGTYTESLPHVDGHAEGLLAATFDGAAVSPAGVAAFLENPSWIAVGPGARTVYAVEETGPDGSVTAFSREGGGALLPSGRESAGGSSPAHLAVHPSGRFLLVGSYGSGTVSVWSLDAEGMPLERTAFVQHEGSGPDPERQEGPHVHQLSVDPVTGDLVVVDLGLGEVRWYAFSEEGCLTLRPEATVVTGGAGPRHLAFHPDGGHAFLVNELESTVAVLRRGADGRFRLAGAASTRAPGADGPNFPAAVRVTGDGRTVLVSNRGDDTIAVFAFDGAESRLRLATFAPAGGRSPPPPDLVLTPEGDRVLVSCQDSDRVTVFAFDPETRALTWLSDNAVPTPVCVVVL
ncbi:lactonase family protein [Leifsonia xyli]|nr:lactonase family protein [Leifsonia xyli]